MFHAVFSELLNGSSCRRRGVVMQPIIFGVRGTRLLERSFAGKWGPCRIDRAAGVICSVISPSSPVNQRFRTTSKSSTMAGRIVLLEPSLTSSTGHFAITAERLTACLAPAPVVVVPGAASTIGHKSSPRFRHNRTAIARIRHYGPTVESLIRHTEAYLPAILRQRRNRVGVAGPGASCARGDAAAMRPLVIDDLVDILRSIRTDARDLLFFPSTDAELILAAAALHRVQPLGPPIALRVMYDDFGSHSTAPTWQSALGLLLGLPKARLRCQPVCRNAAIRRCHRQFLWSRRHAVSASERNHGEPTPDT